MCECEPTRRDLFRGAAVGAAAAIAGGAVLATTGVADVSPTDAAAPGRARVAPVAPQAISTLATSPVTVMPGLSIRPRDMWGADLPPKAMPARETTKFLLVHHTASPNGYSAARDVIRSAYAFQTGPAKGWPDVCYGFFIGRDGDVWEGRAGALTRPVRADATGGNQGWAQLVCLLGDFTATVPTPAALSALARVLAWLAGRDLVSLADGATTTFVSRGSNRWPAGTVVTAPTIAAHRDMSYTACPGDALYPLMPEVRRRARLQADAWRSVIRPAVRLDG